VSATLYGTPETEEFGMNHLGRSTDFRQSKGDTCIDAPAGNSFDEWVLRKATRVSLGVWSANEK
jgi:hypothetical protein